MENILEDFYNKLLEESKPFPSEFMEVLEENFWDLISSEENIDKDDNKL